MPDRLERDEAPQDLPQGTDLPREENFPELDASAQSSELGDVLPPAPPSLRGRPHKKDCRRIKPKLQPGIRTLGQDYTEWIRKKDPNKQAKFKGYERKIARKDKALNDQRYKFSLSWFRRKKGPNEDRLQKWIDGNRELNRLKRILDTPWAERRNAMAKQMKVKLLDPLNAERASLQAEIESLVEKLIPLNTRMRRLLKKIDYANYQVHFCTPPTDSSLKLRIKYKIKKLTDNFSNQLWEQEKIRIAQLHGLQGYLRKKYHRPDLVVEEERLELAMRRRQGRRMKRRTDPGMKKLQAEQQRKEHNNETPTE